MGIYYDDVFLNESLLMVYTLVEYILPVLSLDQFPAAIIVGILHQFLKIWFKCLLINADSHFSGS